MSTFDFEEDFLRTLTNKTCGNLDGRPLYIAPGGYHYTKHPSSIEELHKLQENINEQFSSKSEWQNTSDHQKKLQRNIQNLQNEDATVKKISQNSYKGIRENFTFNVEKLPENLYVDPYKEREYKGFEIAPVEKQDFDKFLQNELLPISIKERKENTNNSANVHDAKKYLNIDEMMYSNTSKILPKTVWNDENTFLEKKFAKEIQALPRVVEINATLMSIKLSAFYESSIVYSLKKSEFSIDSISTTNIRNHMECLQSIGLRYNTHSWNVCQNENGICQYLLISTTFYNYDQYIKPSSQSCVLLEFLDSFVQDNLTVRLIFIPTEETLLKLKNNGILTEKGILFSIVNKKQMEKLPPKNGSKKNLIITRTGEFFMQEFYYMDFTLRAFFYTLH